MTLSHPVSWVAESDEDPLCFWAFFIFLGELKLPCEHRKSNLKPCLDADIFKLMRDSVKNIFWYILVQKRA